MNNKIDIRIVIPLDLYKRMADTVPIEQWNEIVAAAFRYRLRKLKYAETGEGKNPGRPPANQKPGFRISREGMYRAEPVDDPKKHHISPHRKTERNNELIELYLSGKRVSWIAKYFKISVSNVYKLLRIHLAKKKS